MTTAHKQHIYGLHTVQAFLTKMPEQALALFIAKDRHDDRIKQILDLAQALELPIEQVVPSKLNQLSQDGVHQGAVLLAKVREISRK